MKSTYKLHQVTHSGSELLKFLPLPLVELVPIYCLFSCNRLALNELLKFFFAYTLR